LNRARQFVFSLVAASCSVNVCTDPSFKQTFSLVDQAGADVGPGSSWQLRVGTVYTARFSITGGTACPDMLDGARAYFRRVTLECYRIEASGAACVALPKSEPSTDTFAFPFRGDSSGFASLGLNDPAAQSLDSVGDVYFAP
jgi:hypothetical protein